MVQRVLFACTYNATRSPMAQALCLTLVAEGALAEEIEPVSAGVYTGAPLDPMAVEAMAERGADIAAHHPWSFADLELAGGDLEAFDLVVALSPSAHRRAVDYLRDTQTPVELWSIPDATASEGADAARRDAYRAVRDALEEKIRRRFGAPTA